MNTAVQNVNDFVDVKDKICQTAEIWQSGITTLNLLWDGTKLSAEYGFLSHEENALRQVEKKENGIFHMITQIDDTVLKSFQAEINKAIEFNRVKLFWTSLSLFSAQNS
jgi:hypothetical protein